MVVRWYQAAQCSIYLRRLTFYKKWTTFSPGVSANAESASLWPEAWSSWNWCHTYPQSPVWIKESTRVNMNEENLCVDSVGQNCPDLTWRHDVSPCQDVRCMLVRLVMVHVQGPPYQHPSLGWKHTHREIYIYICVCVFIYIYVVFWNHWPARYLLLAVQLCYIISAGFGSKWPVPLQHP